MTQPVCLATSPDGVHFEAIKGWVNPVMPSGTDTQISFHWDDMLHRYVVRHSSLPPLCLLYRTTLSAPPFSSAPSISPSTSRVVLTILVTLGEKGDNVVLTILQTLGEKVWEGCGKGLEGPMSYDRSDLSVGRCTSVYGRTSVGSQWPSQRTASSGPSEKRLSSQTILIRRRCRRRRRRYPADQ